VVLDASFSAIEVEPKPRNGPITNNKSCLCQSIRQGFSVAKSLAPLFVSSKLRRAAPQAAARPMQPKLRATDYRYCGS
jgi:hypothetical protein